MASWIKILNDGGRVNLDQTAKLAVASAGGGMWSVSAYLTDGTTPILGTSFTSQADAMAFIDDLLVDGS